MQKNRKERFFITGGMGYIGSVFGREALKKGHDVCLYDSLMYEQNRVRMMKEIRAVDTKKTELKFIVGDTRNTELLTKSIEEFKPTYVLHLGELSSVYACNHHPALTEDINYTASKKVMDICQKLNIKVLYNSSSSVYGVQKDNKLMTEKDLLPKPTDYYCTFKLKMEECIKNKVKKNPNFKIIVFRPATVFGLSPRLRIELLPNHFTYMGNLRNLQIDCSKFNKEFDFKPNISYEKSIKKVADWMQKNLKNLQSSNFVELLNMPLDEWHKICQSNVAITPRR